VKLDQVIRTPYDDPGLPRTSRKARVDTDSAELDEVIQVSLNARGSHCPDVPAGKSDGARTDELVGADAREGSGEIARIVRRHSDCAQSREV
jgi:hypothetical protein